MSHYGSTSVRASSEWHDRGYTDLEHNVSHAQSHHYATNHSPLDPILLYKRTIGDFELCEVEVSAPAAPARCHT